MANLSSSFNLTPLNLFVGMCRGAAGLPSDFRKLGYADKWIEYAFTNSEGETVVPEIILASDQVEHSLLCEWKSGGNVDTNQLHRYLNIEAQDLQQRAFLSTRSASRHNLTLIGKEEHIDRLTIGIRGAGRNFPVLSVSRHGLSLKENAFDCNELNKVFKHELRINMDTVPTLFVPFDKDSELWVIAERAIPKLLEYMSDREPRILLEGLANDIVPAWKIMSDPFKKELRRKLKSVMDQASRSEFKSFIKPNKKITAVTHTPTWDIVSNPLNLDVDKRRATWRKLGKLQNQFIESLRTGKKRFIQEELFDE